MQVDSWRLQAMAVWAQIGQERSVEEGEGRLPTDSEGKDSKGFGLFLLQNA